MHVPDRCLTCPRIEAQLERIKLHEEDQDGIIKTATSDGLAEVASAISAQLENVPEFIIDELGPPPNSEQITTLLRGIGSKALRHSQENVQMLENDITTLTNWCKGALEITVSRDGIDYDITACASVALLEDDGEGLEPARIKRKD